MTLFIKQFRSLGGAEDGAATANFVVLFSFMISIFFGFFEAGWLMTRWMMLDRGVDAAVREVRLGNDPDLTHNKLKNVLCDSVTGLKNCDRDMLLEVVELNLGSPYPQNQANCVDRTGEIEPKISFNAGGRNRIMFIRACMIVDPFFPGLGFGLLLPKDDSGGFQMVSYTAFMNEPI